MKVVNRLVLAFSFMFASLAHANPITLSLNPATQVSNIGTLVSVSVMIDGLGDGAQSSLAGFVLDVGFDSNVLSFLGYGLTDELGEVGPIFSGSEAEDWSYGYNGLDTVNLALFSNLLDIEIDPVQSSSFSLATLFFMVDVTSGFSDLSLTVYELLATGGQAPNLNLVEVNGATVRVPAPATLLLMGLGLVAMSLRRKNNKTGL